MVEVAVSVLRKALAGFPLNRGDRDLYLRNRDACDRNRRVRDRILRHNGEGTIVKNQGDDLSRSSGHGGLGLVAVSSATRKLVVNHGDGLITRSNSSNCSLGLVQSLQASYCFVVRIISSV